MWGCGGNFRVYIEVKGFGSMRSIRHLKARFIREARTTTRKMITMPMIAMMRMIRVVVTYTLN